MPQRLLGSQEEEVLRQLLKRENIVLDAGSFVTSGGRAEIHLGIDELLADAKTVVRVARVSTGVKLIADDYERLNHLLAGCRDGFMLPKREVSQGLAGWHISVWEACSGSLEQISHDRKLEADELVRYLANIAKALDYLAQRSMLHCDVTPRNILIRNPNAVLSDYDLLLERQDNSAVEFAPRGTPGYIAPDFTNCSVFSADLYSLAVCYAQLRTGEHPFAGKDARKDEPNLKKMGPIERDVVAVALSPDHRDRLRFGDRDIHQSWIGKLNEGLKDDGEGLLRSSSGSPTPVPELDFGIHGIRTSGKTTLLGMTFHKNAQRSMENQGFRQWMVVPAKDADGPGSRTQDYLMEVLDELKNTGNVRQTGMSRSFSLRFEVSLPMKKAMINVEDYGGELVQRKDDEFQGLKELAHARRLKLAASDVHLFFVPLDQHHDDVQFAIDKFKGYLSEAGRRYPEHPRPVIVVAFTKADLVSEIKFDDPKSVAGFRNELMNPSNGDPRFERYKIVNPTRLQELTHGGVIQPFVVSSFGRAARPENGQDFSSEIAAHYGDLWPFQIWVPFGRAVERALDNVETWFDEQLHPVEQHLGANRLAAARDAMSAVEHKLSPYVQKAVLGQKKLERLKAELSSREAARLRRKTRRNLIAGAVAAMSLIATAFVWFNIHAASAREDFRTSLAQIAKLGESEFRQSFALRSKLLDSPFASPWYIAGEELSRQRGLLKIEETKIEDDDFEAEKLARMAPELEGPRHAEERLARIDKIPTLNGRHRADYDAWRKADQNAREDADFETEKLARLAPNLLGPTHAKERLARIDKIPTLSGRHRADYDAWRSADRKELEDADFEAEKLARLTPDLAGQTHAGERLARIDKIPTLNGRHRADYDAWRNADQKELDDADFEAVKLARLTPDLVGPTHAEERQARIDKIPTLNGRHRADYDAWRNADREELYWFNEGRVADQLLAISDARPQEVLDKAQQYHSEFSRSSRDDAIRKKEIAARERLREEAVVAAFDQASSFQSKSTSRAASLKSWREFLEFAGDHKLAQTAKARIQAIEDNWDSEDYQALLRASNELIAKGSTASRKDIADFATAQQAYLRVERLTKRMAQDVQNNLPRAFRLIDGSAKVTISIRKIWVPYWANFWYAGLARGDDDMTSFEVRTRTGTKIWRYRIRNSGECTFGGESLPFSVPCCWDDPCEVMVINRVHSDQPGAQTAHIPLKTQTGTRIELQPAVSSEPAAAIWVDVSMDEFDLTPLKLPQYRSGGESR